MTAEEIKDLISHVQDYMASRADADIDGSNIEMKLMIQLNEVYDCFDSIISQQRTEGIKEGTRASINLMESQAKEIKKARTEGIREGFEAAREGSISNFGQIDFEYDTADDYLNSK